MDVLDRLQGYFKGFRTVSLRLDCRKNPFLPRHCCFMIEGPWQDRCSVSVAPTRIRRLLKRRYLYKKKYKLIHFSIVLIIRKNKDILKIRIYNNIFIEELIWETNIVFEKLRKKLFQIFIYLFHFFYLIF